MINTFLQCLYWIGLVAALAGALRFSGQKKNDRRRCRRCRYDMTGTPGRRCPECGRVAMNERALLVAPRRKALALLVALLALVSYSGVASQRAILGGWTAAIPSTLLIAGYPLIEANLSQPAPRISNKLLAIIHGQNSIPTTVAPGSIADQCWGELAIRARGGRQELSHWQRSWLMKQAISNGSQSDGMLQALGGWESMNDQQRDAYLNTTVRGMIKARYTTALHQPMFLEVGQPGVLADFVVVTTPSVEGCETASIEIRSYRNPVPILQSVGIPESEADGYTIDIQIRDAHSEYEWKGQIVTEAQVQSDLDTLLPPIASDQADSWLQKNAKPTLHLEMSGYCIPPNNLSLEMSLIIPHRQVRSTTASPAPSETEGMVFDAQVELLADGQFIGETIVRLVREPLSQGGAWRQVDLRRVPVKILVSRFWDAVESGQQFEVRCTPSEPCLALSAFDGTSRWSGDITMPLDQLIVDDHRRSSSINRNQPIDPLKFRGTNFSSEHRLDERFADAR